jgi:CubicO group peptidase (beta-lactamase class C family)
MKQLEYGDRSVRSRRALLASGALILIIISSIILFELQKQPETKTLPTYSPTMGWRTAKPSGVGLKTEILTNMITDIKASTTQTRSSLIVKDGYLVVEEYYLSYSKNDKQHLYSCTKSVVSTMIGIAISEGKIKGVTEKLPDLLPTESMEPWMRNITLENLLTMSAGLPGDDWLYDFQGLNEMLSSPDPLKYALTRQKLFEPGSRFEYTDAVSHILSCIITEKTGISAAQYAEKMLFKPLGITDYSWTSDPQGRNWGYAQLRLRTTDMAKIGLLFLNEGTWDDKQLLPTSWVQEATKHRIDANLLNGYGYQLWIDDNGWYTALGYQGQFIMVFPKLNIVAVLTGGTPETYNYNIQLADRFIIPATGV